MPYQFFQTALQEDQMGQNIIQAGLQKQEKPFRFYHSWFQVKQLTPDFLQRPLHAFKMVPDIFLAGFKGY
jgi:hypothetical protein